MNSRILGSIGIALLLMSSAAVAQPPSKHLLSYPLPPGTAGQWSGALGRGSQIPDQHVKFTAPENALVTVFTADGQQLTGQGSLQVQTAVGPVYRFKVSGIESLPGFEVYPSVELIDRLHPPAELAAKFPIPIEITSEDLEFVLGGRLVTRIIYLEQPQLADPTRSSESTSIETINDPRELMEAADFRGRPMAILRIGGRLPDIREANSPMLRSQGALIGPATSAN